MANSKKILIASSIYPPDPGGPATHAKKQFEWFKSQGFNVEMVALAHLRSLPIGIRHLVYFSRLIKKGWNSNIIYAHDALGVGWPAYLISRMLRVPFVMRVGGDIPWERAAEGGRTDLSMAEWYNKGKHKSNISFLLSRYVLRRADALIVTSKILVDLYTHYYGVKKERVTLISNPVETHKEATQVTKNHLIYASRLVAYKNLDFVIKGLVGIFKSDSSFKFIIMGDGPERANLEKLATSLGVKEQIVFTGIVSEEEVKKNISECLLGLAPALTEYNPNYILKCISFGKPFLISSENGLPFSVPDELVFNPRDQKEFKSKLTNLLDSKHYLQAQQLVKNIEFSMSWEQNLEENKKIILHLTS